MQSMASLGVAPHSKGQLRHDITVQRRPTAPLRHLILDIGHWSLGVAMSFPVCLLLATIVVAGPTVVYLAVAQILTWLEARRSR